jgi:hypothetical protein
MLGIEELETSTRVPLYQVCVGVCGYVPSYQALSGAVSQEPGCYGVGPVLKSPGREEDTQ